MRSRLEFLSTRRLYPRDCTEDVKRGPSIGSHYSERRELFNLAPMLPRDTSLSELYKSDRCCRATPHSGRRPNFSKKDLDGDAGEEAYIPQEPFAKIAFFKVDLKCCPMEQSISRMNCIDSRDCIMNCIDSLPKTSFQKS